jgi:hypothetical protein
MRFSAVFGDVEVQTLVDLVAANAAKVKTLEVVEHVFEQAASVINCREVTWAQPAIDLDKRFGVTLCGIFVERCLEEAVFGSDQHA